MGPARKKVRKRSIEDIYLLSKTAAGHDEADGSDPISRHLQ